MTIEQFEQWSLTLGIGGLVLYMLFIIYRLAKDSNAGKWGYIVLFLALGLGLTGFIAKTIIVEIMESKPDDPAPAHAQHTPEPPADPDTAAEQREINE